MLKQQKEDKSDEYVIWIKYGSLLLIPPISLVLIIYDLPVIYFSIISFICWSAAFLDIACIKIGKNEIRFFSKQEVIDEDNRKRLYNSYENVKKFFMLFWRNGRIDKEAFNLISDAYLDGKIFLPDSILREIEEYAEAAKKSYVLENRVKRQHDEKEIIKLNKEIVEINSIFYNADPASIYRNFLCIK